MSKLLFLIVLLVIGGGLYLSYPCLFSGCQNIDTSPYRQDGWFGKGALKAGQKIPLDSTTIRPFTVNISDSVLQDLHYRLANARFIDHIEDTKFTYGFNSLYLKKVVEYWRTKYDWRHEEKKLNAYPQFLTQIEGIDVHFVHVKPKKAAKTVLPLLVVHGWPGSVLEYYKSFSLLTEPVNGVAFEVIAPSIPGYGFSEAPHQKGFNAFAASRVFLKLMKRLGHEKFVVHGGDWGSFISRIFGLIYPENTIGIHVIGNYLSEPNSPCHAMKIILGATVPSLFFGSENAQKDYNKLFPFWEKFSLIMAESGYMHIQATKPDTIGSALVDSPVGLAAYILEKFSTWTNFDNVDKEDGGLTEKFTMDELLTDIMIYWTSGNIASSQRFYKENFKKLLESKDLNKKVKVPAGAVDNLYELMRTPKKLIEDYYENLLQYTELERGGHFTAFEEPELVVNDLRAFIDKLLEQEQKKAAEMQKQKKEQHKSQHAEM